MEKQELSLNQKIFAANKTKEEEYLLKLLGDNFNKSILPYDFPISKAKKNDLKSLTFDLDVELVLKLNKICNNSVVKLQFILSSALFIFLKKYTREDDLSIGTLIYKQEIDADFINTIVVIRNTLDENLTFKEFLIKTKDIIIEAYQNQNYPLDIIIQKLNIPYGKHDYYPFFDIALILENLHTKNYFKDVNYNLLFSFNLKDNNLVCEITYNSMLYREQTILNYFYFFYRTIDIFLSNLDNPIKSIDFVSEIEKDKLIKNFDFQKSNEPTKTVVTLFKEIANITPKKTAIYFNSIEISYNDLDEKSDTLASYLLSLDVKSRIIAIHIEPSIDLIVAILGVLKAGGIFLPIDVDLPTGRKEYMINDSNVYRLICSNTEDFENICMDRVIEIDSTLSSKLGSLNSLEIELNSYAYIIYTSGTTGRPKGTLINHKGLANYIAWAADFYIKAEPLDFPLFTSISFDLTLTSIFTPLITGGSIHIINNSDLSKALKQIYTDDRIGAIKLTPTHIKLFNNVCLDSDNANYKSKIKKAIVGGEQLNPQDINEFSKLFENIEIYNEYGPTETVVGSAVYNVDSESVEFENISVGTPIYNTDIYILDSNLRLVPIGGLGEIYIGGHGVSNGYVNNPELTETKFVDSPFNSQDKIYRTGDIARWRHDGNLEFIGRSDSQIKIRGFRVELSEIEYHLSAYSIIKQVIVLDKGNEADKFLVAYYVSDGEISVAELRHFLSNKLPDYMIPSYFVHLKQIPLTTNGKLDRKALPDPEISISDKFIAPTNQTEERLIGIWGDVLKINSELISTNTSFFELGGNSLKATILAARIHKEFEIQISLLEIFSKPTVKELSGYLSKQEITIFKSIIPTEKRFYYPQSSAQKRMFVLAQMDDKAGVNYNIQGLIALGEKTDKERLEKTFKKIISRHESLRTSFHLHEKEPIQKVETIVDFHIEIYQIKQVDLARLQKDFIKPFDLTIAPLLRVAYVEVQDSHQLLLFDMHHIITDMISQDVLEKEFKAFYNDDAVLTPLKLQYKDFAIWQQTGNQNELMEKQERYWLSIFSDDIPVLELNYDYPRPKVQSFDGASTEFFIDENESNLLKSLAQDHDSTLHMVLLSISYILLHKLSQQDDIIIGIPVVGRRHADLEKVIGLFVNSLAIRNNPRGELDFLSFLKEVKISALNAYENQDYQFEELVINLPLKRDTSRNPIYDVMLNYISKEEVEINAKSLDVIKNHQSGSSNFDLLISPVAYKNNIYFRFDYCSKLFKEETVDNYVDYLKKIIKTIIANPDIKISDIEIISDAEKQKLLYHFNNTKVDFPKDKTLTQLFEEQVMLTPFNVAIVFEDQQITYDELNKKTDQYAVHLRENGVNNEFVVGLMFENSIEMIFGILSVLKSGGAYMPISPDYPAKRMQYMVNESEMKLLLTHRKLMTSNMDALFNMAEAFDGITIYLDDEINEKKYDSNDPVKMDSNQLAYIIYTSGSTGIPKGIMIEHRSVVNLIFSQIKIFGIDDKEKILQLSTFTFDASVEQIFLSCLSGASLVLIEKDTITNKERFNNYIVKNGVTHIHTVPILLEDILEYNKILKRVISGGDICPISLPKKWYKTCDFYNEYGPTETTVTSIEYLVKEMPNDRTTLPIGKPIGNTSIYIMDKNMNIQPLGVVGELCISGAGLSRGYLKKEEQTKEKFVLNPYSEGEVLYKTGDLARWLPDGNIEFFGRIDDQVKIRGFRIELGEIENQLKTFDGVKAAIVLTKAKDSGEKYLCAYYLSDNEINKIQLKQHLEKTLTDYMIPSHFIHLKELPLNANGKLNKNALPELEFLALHRSVSNELEARMLKIWSMVLKQKEEKISIDSNFFDLGGHSVNLIQLNYMIQKEFCVNISITDIYIHSTIYELTLFINSILNCREEGALIEEVII